MSRASEESLHPTDADMRAALKRSGYLLEQRVASVLTGAGMAVVPNPTYVDPISQKHREIDIEAIKHQIGRVCVNDQVRLVIGSVRLFFECVNNPQPVVFFSAAGDQADSMGSRRYIKYCGGWDTVPHTGQSFMQRVGLWPDIHHYSRTAMHSQYCTFQQKKAGNGRSPEWMATHEEAHHFSFDSLLARWRLALLPSREPQHWLTQLCYGVVVLQGEMYSVEQSEDEPQLTHVDHLGYVVQRPKQDAPGVDYFVVDVMTEAHVPSFIADVEKELSTLFVGLNASPELLYPDASA